MTAVFEALDDWITRVAVMCVLTNSLALFQSLGQWVATGCCDCTIIRLKESLLLARILFTQQA